MSAKNTKILAIEDDEDILGLIRYNLEKEGYQVTSKTSGDEGLDTAILGAFDLIILDLMLSGIDGFEICKTLKAEPKTASIPIVMLTAKNEDTDIVTGLEIGADDYITKPFSPKILIARIRACLRRQTKVTIDQNSVIKFRDLVIHPGRHEVLLNGKPLDLTLTEFRLLHLLARRPGWVFTRYQIVNAVRGEDYFVTDRTVDVQIVGLRKKLGQFGKYIETVRGVGYRMRENR